MDKSVDRSIEKEENQALPEQMTDNSIFEDISGRTGGNIYISAVGPVRTGKSTFIKKFNFFELFYLSFYEVVI